MTRQSGPPTNEEYLRQGSANNSTIVETIPRWAAAADLAIAATGVVLSVGIPLQTGDVVTNITFVTGATALGTPTAGFAALYSSAATPALLAQTADFTSTARAANTAFTVALATAQTIVTPGIYYVAISFTGGTIPTLRGATVANAVMAGAVTTGFKVLAQSHGAAVAGVAPATIATPTTVFAIPYLVVT